MNDRIKYSIIFLTLFLLVGNTFVSAQFKVIANNKGWLPINASNGGVINDVISIQLHAENNANQLNWSVVGRITSPIMNGDQRVFPVEKVKLRYNNLQLSQYFMEINPTIPQIGIIQSDVTMSYSPTYLIKNSLLPIEIPAGGYGNIVLGYDVSIDGGTYLNSYKSWNNYVLNFEISILNEFGRIISTSTFPLQMQISPNGNFESVPTLSIALNPESRNANLSFSKMKDYVSGVSVEYPKALVVNADTAYEINVASTSNQLQGIGEGLDVNTIQVKLKDDGNGSLSNAINLSTIPQKLAEGSITNSEKNYSIIYSTKPADQTIINSKPGNYTTTLIYTISPL